MGEAEAHDSPYAASEPVAARVTGFHSEWLTIGRHRVLIEKRHGFPDEQLRFHARLAAEVCDQWGASDFGDAELATPEGDWPYVLAVFCDDGRAATTTITVGTVNGAAVAGIDRRMREVFNSIYLMARFECEITVVREGEVGNPDYHIAEHLSSESGISADRGFPRTTDIPPR